MIILHLSERPNSIFVFFLSENFQFSIIFFYMKAPEQEYPIYILKSRSNVKVQRNEKIHLKFVHTSFKISCKVYNHVTFLRYLFIWPIALIFREAPWNET